MQWQSVKKGNTTPDEAKTVNENQRQPENKTNWSNLAKNKEKTLRNLFLYIMIVCIMH